MTDELLNRYLSELDSIDKLAGESLRNKYLRLKQVMERSCKEITLSESLQFSSLFSRLVYIAQYYNLPKNLEWALQNIRVKSNYLLRDENNLVHHTHYEQALHTLQSFYKVLAGLDIATLSLPSPSTQSSKGHQRLRVQIIKIDRSNEYLVCRTDSEETQPEIIVRYNVEKVNDLFNESINHIWVGAQLNLIDVHTDNEGYYIPKTFILEPDYLIDASAIAECFQSFAKSHFNYLRRKFEPVSNSHHILLGNLANYFLDELIYTDDAKELRFEETFIRSFAQMPFEYSSCKEITDTNEFREFMRKAQTHFKNIQRVVVEDLHQNGFDRHACILEPSFFSEQYGFQGRLDLLQHASSGNEKSRIIELKSGKAPFPADDPTKISLNHEVQTAVYRMMIQSVLSQNARDVYPTILYSSVNETKENLRWVASYQQLEKDILNTRNLIIATEHALANGSISDVQYIFDGLFNLDNYEGNKPDFFTQKLAEMLLVLTKVSQLEREYFYRFVSFISKELYLLKLGDEGFDSFPSLSALWTTNFEERKEALELLSDLEIENIEISDHDMLIRFKKEVEAHTSSNFREGEICILYPRQSANDTILTNQILKATIVEISSNHVLLRSRYKQRNNTFFDQYKYWVIEHDKLDHSYNAMFKCLFAFLSAPPQKRKLLLGLRSPQSLYTLACNDISSPKAKQEDIISKALSAQDYFLIVGPPGTGKTSIFARELVKRIHADNESNIMVIAYTNRAVDELCTAICSAFGEEEIVCDKYIRVGSSLSCGINYRHRLLQELSYEVKNRKELSSLITKTRIFVGTLASIIGKPELLSLKKFHTAIIDEASQILEPQIIGLLPNFDRFILIGDNKQLSTITLQNKIHSQIKEENLNSIHLFDCRESLFERLYDTCNKNEWTQAYDTLTYHGRMHKEIASFVNQYFYEGKLKEATSRQTAKLSYEIFNHSDTFETLVANNRIAFVPIQKSNFALSNKINEDEANIIVSLTIALRSVYKQNGIVFDPETSIGIIAPYRNQIALIKEKLKKTGFEELSKIMVDTVERFQGSQRDTILVSFCMSQPYQLSYFCNMNKDNTVDRKLNVAITRAKEQLFLVGDETILNQHPIYRILISNINRNRDEKLPKNPIRSEQIDGCH